jgi:hypothetical protein
VNRYGIFRVLPPEGEIGWHVELMQYSVSHGYTVSAQIPPNPIDGTPTYNFAFCNFAGGDMLFPKTLLNAYVFPDYPLDAELAGMDTAKRREMMQNVEAYDWDGQGFHLSFAKNNDGTDFADLTRSYRDFLCDDIYRALDPSFTSDDFDRMVAYEA